MLTASRLALSLLCATVALVWVGQAAAAAASVRADQSYYPKNSVAHLTASDLSSCAGVAVEMGLYREPFGTSGRPDLKVPVTVSAQGSATADVAVGGASGYYRAAVVGACLSGGSLRGDLVYVGAIIDAVTSVVTDRRTYESGDTVQVEAIGFVDCAGQEVQIGIFAEGKEPIVATATVDFVNYGATVSVVAGTAGTAFPGVRSCVSGTITLGNEPIVIGAPSPPDAGNGAMNAAGDRSGRPAFAAVLVASGALLLAAATLQRRR